MDTHVHIEPESGVTQPWNKGKLATCFSFLPSLKQVGSMPETAPSSAAKDRLMLVGHRLV
jgi:hypothetical protein